MRNDILPGRCYFETLANLLSALEVTDDCGRAFLPDEGSALAVRQVIAASRGGGLVALVGNGGSAAIAAHMQIDLSAAGGARAVVFNDPPLLTALSNDHGYDNAFEMQMRLWAPLGGMLVAISSSGASENILRAARTAREFGLTVLTMTGFLPDNPLRALGHVNLYVPSANYGYVELAHSVLSHYLTDAAVLALGRGVGSTRVGGEVDAPRRM